ncbi:holo-ACP synthase [Mucilaginibacter sp. SP1R1]|uniref:holo-ACP synthase n=1 Tax=Mucilaginibacter sp. SP1R1 TaxID=2723091 RepID=UPI0017FF4744|nr:holo-ACP synthase [Mucilaginibacter sp. SP1R1]MBB6151700.1 phosphopantetheine--protein transferase-like protein [Mucilaginibacter sp. SP1R1]
MENEILNQLDELNRNRKFAVGNDLVFIPDFLISLTDLFRNKVYTPTEIAYCSRFNDAGLRYASTWAAKEAVYKALKQISPRSVGWKKIEIIREKISGQPQVVLHNYPNQFNISLTISHDGEYAWAVAFIALEG